MLTTTNTTQPSPDFIQAQQQFAAAIRDPASHSCPAGVDEKRIAIYQHLLFDNIQGVLNQVYPTLKQVLSEAQWHTLARDFFASHAATLPQFYQIAEEFLYYLQGAVPERDLPPFLLELAHYEWVELALSIDPATCHCIDVNAAGDLVRECPVVSPLVWVLAYQFPVHQISAKTKFKKLKAQPTYLIAYRNAMHRVHFMQVNDFTVRLISLLQGEAMMTGLEAIRRIIKESDHPHPMTVLRAGIKTLKDLQRRDVILGTGILQEEA